MNILFYYPDKERGVSLSSLMVAFQKQGHTVSLLTQTPEGDLHSDVRKEGIKTFTHVIKKNSLLFYLKHILFLISFTKKNKIDLVYSHIQKANFIACFAQYFSRARFILCRHHSDCAFVDNNRNEKLMDKIINRLGKEFIVPSDVVLDQMLVKEKVKNKKIHLIRYAYDFNAYPKPDEAGVFEIKEKYKAKLLLVKIARLITEKRHILLFQVINKLVKAGYDIKLVVLSDGPEKEKLVDYIRQNELQNSIFMVGYRRDIMNFIAATDVVVHVSESEASSNLAKEVGLLNKPLIVCSGVGDFDEYLINRVNSLIIDKNNVTEQLEKLIISIYNDEKIIEGLGKKLHDTVFERFSIENIISQYNQFHTKI